jgi:RNA polymerase sigma factor for flagellar operon FliA
MHGAYAAARPARTREELVREGIPLVRRLAFRMATRLPKHVEVDDLISAGSEGLIKAAAAYDPARQPHFQAYARERIRGAILDELRSSDAMTSYGRKQLAHVTKRIRELEGELGRQPTEEEIAKALDLTLERYQQLAESLARGPALGRLGETDPDEVVSSSFDPSELLSDKETRQRLADAIKRLPERTQLVLSLYYQEDCTQAEIAAVLEVTESRVCQLLGEAVARLRASFDRNPPKRAKAEGARAERA